MRDDDNPTKSAPEGANPRAEREQAEGVRRNAAAQPSASEVKRPTAVQVPAPEFTRVSAPSPALPKGGGALRAIGETFQTNPSTGTGSLAIPLGLPAGRGGASPELALAYDSGAGNGLFGLGWSVGIPAITRKTDKGLPQYCDFAESDVFQLAGAEDLVPARKFDTGTSTWVDDKYETATHVVQRYRPRVEGAFSRIERWTHKTIAGDVHWVATSRANVKSTFGTSAATRIADPANPTHRVFSWLLERVEDDRGNVVTYEYKAEDLQSVEVAAYENHRRNGRALVTHRHPKRVRWGNTTMGDASTAQFEVVFDYGEHDALAPTRDAAPGVTWPRRQDPFSVYRAGFEMRTWRLCRRVLVFHHFPELGATPCLVRSLDLAYDEHPAATTLRSVTAAGYIREAGGTYTRQAMPAFEVSYSMPTRTPGYAQFQPGSVDEGVVRDLGSRTQWVDLDGEGIAGLLTQTETAMYYARNLGGHKLARARRLPTRPVLGGGELRDIDGDGTLELVRMESPPQGFFERDTEGDDWGSFRPFRQLPDVDWSSPQTRLIDLDGDGFDDVLVVTPSSYVYYPSKAEEGFGPPKTVPRSSDEERAPGVPFFSTAAAAVFLADMTGDGLADLVRVEPTRVVYWPNLGHARFGPMVVMSSSPHCEPGRRFDGARVRLADLDGTGTADLLYFGPDGLSVWFNQSGNRYSAPVRVPGFPVGEVMSSLSIADVRGNGTSCVTWVPSRRAGAPAAVVRVLDFVGPNKPYLLTFAKNNLGLETTVTYAPSTKFYLADRAAGKPWASRLPFPVQVVEKVETYDAIAKARLTKTFAYHHGAYDPDEREFRGFGMVESWDTESFAAVDGKGVLPPGPPPVGGEQAQHPVRTRTWFHTGVWKKSASLEAAYAKEYYSPAAPAPDPRLLPPTVFPNGMTLAEQKHATRALKGAMLRQEVYADDGIAQAAIPYSVAHQRYEVVRVQPPRGGTGRTAEQAVFLTHAKEAVSTYYERVATDPRVTHSYTVEVDAYGTVKKAVTVAYGRASGDPEQQKQWAVLAENDVVHLDASATEYRLAVPLGSRVYELHGLAAPSPGPLHSFATIQTAANTASAIAYEQAPTTGLQKRIVAHVKTRYYNATSLPNPLAFGAADAKALVYEAYALALTPGLITQVFGTDVTSAILTEGGYVELAGETGQWTPSGRQLPDATKFYLPSEIRDPWGNVTTLVYDAHEMFVTTVTDPAGNVSSASYDYRVLTPSLVTDPNGNRREASFNPLGLPTGEAVMGKVGSTDGDTLADPTVKYTYDFLRYATTGKPAFVKTEVREKHGAAQYGTPPGRWQTTHAYSNGSGGVAMTKVQAEPGDAPLRDASGNLILDAQGKIVIGPVTTRWVGTGKTVLNNKGNPIKQYEPFFSSTHEFETEDELVQWGVTPLFYYDPPGRLVKTELPHGGIRRVVITNGWEEDAWDENDTVLDPGNLWYAARQAGATPPPSAAEQRAADLADDHAGTPTTTKVDAMGRPYVVRQRLTATTFLDTKTALDIEGQPLSVTDPLGRACMQYVYGVDGQLLREISIDAGTRKSLSDVAGAPLRSWDSVLHVRRTLYDTMRRPTHLYVKKGAAAEYLAQRTLYGESYPTPEVQNRRGRPCMTFDGGGVILTESYDFKGNLLGSTRRLATTHTTEPNWTAVASSATPSAALTAATSLLETEAFTKTFAYDAMNRAISVAFPDTSEVRPGYNEAGLLEKIDVRIRGAGTWTAFVSDIDYDEKGRRERIDYGNGTFTEYTYDKLTFRLTRLKTTRTSDTALLQNLFYTYDCIGNIVAIADTAQQTVFFNNAVVTPSADYEYDAIYRLVKASGREHAGGIADVQRDQNDSAINNLPHANDLQAVRRYEERFVYDAVGNFLEFIHDAGPGQPTGSWTRRYKYGAGTGDNTSNRLLSTSLPGDPVGGPYTATYTHDTNGNMTAMPHLASIAYTHADQMREANLGGGGTAYYMYDAGGERVLKRIHRVGTLVEERIYLGGYEVYRKRDSTGLLLERQTLHVMDDTRRVAMVETKTVDTTNPGSTGVSRLRYQYTNHLDSALLEADAAGLVISYEEYHPYGTTSYQSARSGVDVSARRYRYTGKERDEETGIYYHGARYYCAWLGRWVTSDPLGVEAGLNFYLYVGARPIGMMDPTGLQEVTPENGRQREPTAWETAKAVGDYFYETELGAHSPFAKGIRPTAEAAVGVATAVKAGIETPLELAGDVLSDPVGVASRAKSEVETKGLWEASKRLNFLVAWRTQLRAADELAKEGKTQEATNLRAQVLLGIFLIGRGVTGAPSTTGGAASAPGVAAVEAGALAVGAVTTAQAGLAGALVGLALSTGGTTSDDDIDPDEYEEHARTVVKGEKRKVDLPDVGKFEIDAATETTFWQIKRINRFDRWPLDRLPGDFERQLDRTRDAASLHGKEYGIVTHRQIPQNYSDIIRARYPGIKLDVVPAPRAPKR